MKSPSEASIGAVDDNSKLATAQLDTMTRSREERGVLIKTLVVCYSRTGNTALLADKISKLFGADSDRIICKESRWAQLRAATRPPPTAAIAAAIANL